MKTKLPVNKCLPQRIGELATEQFRQRVDRERELRMSGDPPGVIDRQSAGWQHAVDMGVELQLLIPTMQHAEEADFSAEMPWIACHLQQCFCAGLEE